MKDIKNGEIVNCSDKKWKIFYKTDIDYMNRRFK